MKDFRGLTKDGKMVYGWYAEIESKHFIIDIKAELRPLTAYGKYGKPGEGWKEFFGTYGIAGFIEVIPATVAQQVGLKDKHGKEIYAGDKIKFGNNKFWCVVVWNDKGFYQLWRNGVIHWTLWIDDYYHNSGHRKDLEVVGNIHQDGELLENPK